MKKLKRIFIYIKLKLKGYTDEMIYTTLVLQKLMSFEEYEKFYDNKVIKDLKKGE